MCAHPLWADHSGHPTRAHALTMSKVQTQPNVAAAEHQRDGRCHPGAGYGRRSNSQFRPSRYADGHGRRGNRAVSEVLRFDPKAPAWPDRDRFVLSAGHGSMLLYSLLLSHRLSRHGGRRPQEFSPARLQDCRSPRIRPRIGIETTTGPLGQGLANAVGMALSERCWRPASAGTSSITTPTSSPAMAA